MVQQVMVPARLIPGKCPAGIRIVRANHAYLIAVIDAGSAQVCKHKNQGQLQGNDVVADAGQEARHIVAVEKI